MPRQTSLTAFALIQDRNILGPFQLAVLEIILQAGPLTVGEAAEIYQKRFPQYTKRGRNEVAKRFYELEQEDIIATTGETRAGRDETIPTNVYDLTDRAPENRKEKKLSNAKKVESLTSLVEQAITTFNIVGMPEKAKAFQAVLKGLGE